ncbi:MAG TPA: S-layer homology domain-containing protein [Desulfosporosinus sp.]|nr:S-layer homology domain-containing protein [Desulfosporosinus sp.]
MTGHWAKDTIQNWVNQGIVNGYEDGTFRPRDILREQLDRTTLLPERK